MTEPLKRNDIIDLLNRLGSNRDDDVLEAARRAHGQITAAGVTWDDLLVPDDTAGVDETGDDDTDDDTSDDDDTDDDTSDDDDTGDDDTGDDETADDETLDLEDANGEAPAEKAEPAGRAGIDADSRKLIDELLARPGISADLREELNGYKTDIADGEFLEADRRYLRALHKRLSKTS